MATPVSLPTAFDPDAETQPVLARAKKRASRNFRWTSAACLSNGTELAFLCHMFGRDAEALEICRFLAQYQFAGDFRPWSPLELALALHARLCRQRGEDDTAAACVQRIHAAGFVAARLEGGLLDPEAVARAARDGSKALERDYRLRMLQELCFMIALGGSEKCPVAALEQDYRDNLARLRTLVGAG